MPAPPLSYIPGLRGLPDGLEEYVRDLESFEREALCALGYLRLMSEAGEPHGAARATAAAVAVGERRRQHISSRQVGEIRIRTMSGTCFIVPVRDLETADHIERAVMRAAGHDPDQVSVSLVADGSQGPVPVPPGNRDVSTELLGCSRYHSPILQAAFSRINPTWRSIPRHFYQ